MVAPTLIGFAVSPRREQERVALHVKRAQRLFTTAAQLVLVECNAAALQRSKRDIRTHGHTIKLSTNASELDATDPRHAPFEMRSFFVPKDARTAVAGPRIRFACLAEVRASRRPLPFRWWPLVATVTLEYEAPLDAARAVGYERRVIPSAHPLRVVVGRGDLRVPVAASLARDGAFLDSVHRLTAQDARVG